MTSFYIRSRNMFQESGHKYVSTVDLSRQRTSNAEHLGQQLARALETDTESPI